MISQLSVKSRRQLVFFTSDLHLDSVYCNRDQLFSDLDEAKRRGAKICLIGDIFDAMNGRFDPRRSFDGIRPEYRGEDYYDRIVKDAIKLLSPYREDLFIITPGNHELSVLKNANTFLSERLVVGLNELGGNIFHGGYGGWIKVHMEVSSTHASTFWVKYFHGAGGEAPVTRGVIQTNRQAVFLPDADVVINGHSHNAYWVPITRERVSQRGRLFFDQQHHIRTPGYVQAYGDGTAGWEVTRGGVPKPLGGCFVEFYGGGETKAVKDRSQPSIKIEPLISSPLPISPKGVYEGIVFPQE